MSKKIKKKNNVKIKVENRGANVAAYLYVLLMLGVFPLFYRNGYIDIMESKWGFFSITTLIAVAVAGIATIILVCTRYEDVKKDSWKSWLKTFSITDWCVILLMVSVLISWLFCDYKSEAFSGSAGKMAGVYFYLILFIAYFLVSRYLKYDQWVLLIYIITNFIVFGLAILNHFMIDPLGMYSNLAEDNYWMFITTMGNINVLAGYLCVFVPVTMVLFCFCETLLSQVIYGVFMVISFMGLISANGDAGIIGIAAAFLFLFWFCFESYDRLKRFFLMATLFFAGAGLIGWLDNMNIETVKEPLATLPSFIGKSTVSHLAIIVFAVFTVIMFLLQKKEVVTKPLKVIRNIVFILIGLIALAGFSAFIYLSTAGSSINLGEWDTYLRFSDLWGSSRGFTWKRVLIIYGEDYHVIQKLFGYGPDLLGVPLHERFNDQIFAKMGAYLVDAHNETLQVLSTVGIFGVVGYMGAQITACRRFAKSFQKDPFLLAVATGVVAYIAQGMMSSPQTFGTPILFIGLAIGESIMRGNRQNENIISSN
jgi:hypothetical protein